MATQTVTLSDNSPFRFCALHGLRTQWVGVKKNGQFFRKNKLLVIGLYLRNLNYRVYWVLAQFLCDFGELNFLVYFREGANSILLRL